jgi:hypothetical protein
VRLSVDTAFICGKSASRYIPQPAGRPR